MSQLAASEGQPGNWEEPGFFLHRLETVKLQENGWQERYDGRLSRTDLWGRGGEIPPALPDLVATFLDLKNRIIHFQYCI
jgi:hypothetical protein